ncbi:peptidylprolyl isomerase [Methanolobus sp.]|jgi:FKBP-type peptidyl-prolyl cis-trans isomerase 2|uniref:FKBP-type peptidyl-prolyl cis-trans isomerase n=1 Tax=Methanolobus sp. TaxID=1874737 RepID=UPI0025E8B787|nr:peptidylprolyl isomerase [Methanolobus sp.]
MKKILFLILLCSLLVSGCTDSSDNSQTVETGDYVSVNYTGSLEDGSVFDTSIEEVAVAENVYNPYRSYGPLSFIAGAGQMIKGFDDAVIGMEVGENKTVTIPPEEAYGAYCPELLIPLPVEDFQSANVTPVIGQKVTYQNQLGTIVNISDKNVTVDCNHNLAGEILIFKIELVSIEKA